MKSMENRIAEAEQKLKALRERHAKAEAKRKKAELAQARIDDERRRLICGTVVLEMVRTGEITDTQFRTWLESALTDPKDRALFKI